MPMLQVDFLTAVGFYLTVIFMPVYFQVCFILKAWACQGMYGPAKRNPCLQVCRTDTADMFHRTIYHT